MAITCCASPKTKKQALPCYGLPRAGQLAFLRVFPVWEASRTLFDEIRMGRALAERGHRHKVFLMTKLDSRTKEATARQIEMSLRRLRTDYIDLIQHHEVLRYEDPDRIFAQGGAMEAVPDAKRAGEGRYIGFTGDKDPHSHLYMLKVAQDHAFHFDTVRRPLNLMDAHFHGFEKLVMPVAVIERIGILGMKPLGAGCTRLLIPPAWAEACPSASGHSLRRFFFHLLPSRASSSCSIAMRGIPPGMVSFS
ncbi:MAG: aldo/keto reductase [Terriglobia bacterium]